MRVDTALRRISNITLCSLASCTAVCSYSKFRRFVWLLLVDPRCGKACVYKGLHIVYNNTNGTSCELFNISNVTRGRTKQSFLLYYMKRYLSGNLSLRRRLS